MIQKSIQLRFLRNELSDDPPELQFRYITDDTVGNLFTTKWEPVPTHTKKINGDVVDDAGNIVEYGCYSVCKVDPSCQLVEQRNIGSINPLFSLPDGFKKLFG